MMIDKIYRSQKKKKNNDYPISSASHRYRKYIDIFIPLPFPFPHSLSAFIFLSSFPLLILSIKKNLRRFFEYGISVRFWRFFSLLGFDILFGNISGDSLEFAILQVFRMTGDARKFGSSAFWTWDFGGLDTRVWKRNTEKSALTLVPQFQTLIAVTSSLSPLTSLSEFSV
ncbi:unnamed protein product [Rhizophagus irregularis]|nr:unnamed protein product [Rhizophagus irregularis]